MSARARLYSDQLILAGILVLSFVAVSARTSVTETIEVAVIGLGGCVAMLLTPASLYVVMTTCVAAVSVFDLRPPINIGGVSLYSTYLLTLLSVGRALLPRGRLAPRTRPGGWALSAKAISGIVVLLVGLVTIELTAPS